MAGFLEKLFVPGKVRGNSRWARIVLAAVGIAAVLIIVFNAGAIVSDIREMEHYLHYAFVRRALLVGVPVSLCAALLGVTLVLKRYSMIGDGLSHVGFGALSIAAALGYVSAASLPAFLPLGVREMIAGVCRNISEGPMIFTLVIVVLMAFVILRINSTGSGLRGDAAVAVLSTGALALGVIVTSLTSGMNVDLMNYMFGSILAMSGSDVFFSLVLSVFALIIFVLLYNRIFAVTFDEVFAKATGTHVGAVNALIALLTALTVVVGMRMMGTMLISSLIIFPALSSMRLFSRFRYVLISSAVISVVCFAAGLTISCVHGIPAGAAVVMSNLTVFLVFLLIERAR